VDGASAPALHIQNAAVLQVAIAGDFQDGSYRVPVYLPFREFDHGGSRGFVRDIPVVQDIGEAAEVEAGRCQPTAATGMADAESGWEAC